MKGLSCPCLLQCNYTIPCCMIIFQSVVHVSFHLMTNRLALHLKMLKFAKYESVARSGLTWFTAV